MRGVIVVRGRSRSCRSRSGRGRRCRVWVLLWWWMHARHDTWMVMPRRVRGVLGLMQKAATTIRTGRTHTLNLAVIARRCTLISAPMRGAQPCVPIHIMHVVNVRFLLV